MIGVILAAGKGRRIENITGGKPKSFLKLGDKRIIDHQIDTLRQYSIPKIVIIIGYRGEYFEKEYTGTSDIILLRNPFYNRTNVLASLWFAREYLSNGFYFMHADTYFDPVILGELTKQKEDIVLAVNHKDTALEDMKVRIKDGLIVEVNKEMDCETAHGEFIGLARISPHMAPKVVEKLRQRIEVKGRHDDFFESIIQDIIDEGGIIRDFGIGDNLAIEIDFPDDYSMAKELYEKLGK